MLCEDCENTGTRWMIKGGKKKFVCASCARKLHTFGWSIFKGRKGAQEVATTN